MSSNFKKDFLPVQDEVYQLLLTAFCYHRKLEHLETRLKTQSREFLLEEVTALRHLSNGIILHLCNLDDDDGKWTLRSLRKERAGESAYQVVASKCNDALKRYRSDLNAFKTKHRNAYIAHRSEVEYPNPLQLPDLRNEFAPLIRSAVAAFEELWGSSCSFTFNLGSQETTIDFKSEFRIS